MNLLGLCAKVLTTSCAKPLRNQVRAFYRMLIRWCVGFLAVHFLCRSSARQALFSAGCMPQLRFCEVERLAGLMHLPVLIDQNRFHALDAVYQREGIFDTQRQASCRKPVTIDRAPLRGDDGRGQDIGIGRIARLAVQNVVILLAVRDKISFIRSRSYHRQIRCRQCAEQRTALGLRVFDADAEICFPRLGIEH